MYTFFSYSDFIDLFHLFLKLCYLIIIIIKMQVPSSSLSWVRARTCLVACIITRVGGQENFCFKKLEQAAPLPYRLKHFFTMANPIKITFPSALVSVDYNLLMHIMWCSWCSLTSCDDDDNTFLLPAYTKKPHGSFFAEWIYLEIIINMYACTYTSPTWQAWEQTGESGESTRFSPRSNVGWVNMMLLAFLV